MKKSYITPLFVQTNSFSGEKLAVGLLAKSGDKWFFKYSADKLNTAKKLTANKEFTFIKHLLDTHKKAATTGLGNMPFSFTEEYFAYVNQYSNGLLVFETPKPYSEVLDSATFEELFIKFVTNQPLLQMMKPQNLHQKVNSLAKQYNLKEKADVDYELKPAIFKGLLKSEKLTMITKNGVVQAFQALDFEHTSMDQIGYRLYALNVVNKSLDAFCSEHNLNLDKIGVIFTPVSKGLNDKEYKQKEDFFNTIYGTLKNQYNFEPDDSLEEQVKAIASSNHIPFSKIVKAV